MVTIQDLKEFGLFAELDDDQLTRIAELCHESALEDGALCFAQGKKASELHLCRGGRVYILLQAYDMEVLVHTAKAGEVFGWSALVKPYSYTASARCAGKVDVIYIKRPDLIGLFTQDPLIGYIIMRNLSSIASSRLTKTTEKLSKEIAAASDLNRERGL